MLIKIISKKQFIIIPFNSNMKMEYFFAKPCFVYPLLRVIRFSVVFIHSQPLFIRISIIISKSDLLFTSINMSTIFFAHIPKIEVLPI